MAVVAGLLALFVALPLAIGWLEPNYPVAAGLLVLIGVALTVSQSRDDELGGVWVVFAALVILDLGLVYASHVGRRRRRRRPT
jgi:hypothetical protein